MSSRPSIRRAASRVLAAAWLVVLALAGPAAASSPAGPAVPLIAAPQSAAHAAAPAGPAAGAPALPGSPASLTNTLSLAGAGYIHIPNAPQLNPPGAITLEAWVRRSALQCEAVVAKDFSTGYWLGFCSNTLRFYTGAGLHTDGTATVPAGVWTHVAVSYDGCHLNFYVNGFLDSSTVCLSPGSPLPVTSDDWAIGASNNGGFKFSGSLAEVRLWRTVRSQADIRRDMLRVIDTADPDLAAAWHLEGNAAGYLGQNPGAAVGTLAFNGPSAPSSAANPIQIPRLTVAPTVDANCQPSEYAGLALPIWYTDAYNGYGLRYVNVAATTSDVYVCLSDLPIDAFTQTFASLYLDLNNSGGAAPQTSDYRLSGLHALLACANEHGNGLDNYTGSNALAGVACAVTDNDEFQWSAEFRFPRAAITGPNGLFRMQFIHHWKAFQADDHGWPLDADWLQPAAWPTFHVNDSLIVPADSQNPVVIVQALPVPLHQTDPITISGRAADDVDLASLDLLVDNHTVLSCTFNGAHDTLGNCQAAPHVYSVGLHGYSARAVDQRGRLGYSAGGSFFVPVDGQAPTIHYGHTPRTGALGGSVTITATASDPSGIASLSIALGYGLAGSVSCAASACSTTITPSGGPRVVYYTVSAVDHEGLHAASPSIPLLFGNTGADADGDHIVDAIENQMCTDPNNADSDGDGLTDDWEILGLTFGDGGFVNLPGLGANPCRRDLFVQYDYERGAHAEPGVWPAILSLFTQHGVTLHLTQNERPRPGATPISTVGAEVASSMLDSAGHYYLDPKLAWVTHYMYSNNNPGNSGTWHYPTINVNTNNCPLATADPQNDPACGPRDAGDETYRIVHELGHTLGLGHGGRLGAKVFGQRGDVVVYTGGWDNTNLKPNYVSVMNYGYSGVPCYNAASGAWLMSIDYSDSNYGSLNEASLSEAAGSSFALQVRANPCPSNAGYVRVFRYGCTDAAGAAWVVSSDGNHILSRIRSGTDWQTTGLPVLPTGIDWNCDGAISGGSVNTNLNGDGASSGFDNWYNAGSSGEVLTSPNDWATLPFQPSSVCFILNDDADTGPGLTFPKPYIDLMGQPDCRLSSVGVPHAASSASPQAPQFSDPDTPHFDPPQPAVSQPRLEICDATDNDGNGQVDEGCPDGDADQVVDALDSCPQTPNPNQADFDNNHLSDACQFPALQSLTFQVSSNTLTLSWTGATTDILGFAVYRQCLGEAGLRYLGNGYPTTLSLTYADTTAPNRSCGYTVRPVNLLGVESPGLTVNTWPYHLQLPVVGR